MTSSADCINFHGNAEKLDDKNKTLQCKIEAVEKSPKKHPKIKLPQIKEQLRKSAKALSELRYVLFECRLLLFNIRRGKKFFEVKSYPDLYGNWRVQIPSGYVMGTCITNFADIEQFIVNALMRVDEAKTNQSAPKKKQQTQRPQKALSELIETKSFINVITPLPKYDNPNSKWITSQKAAEKLSISEKRLSNMRSKNECVNYKEPEYAGYVIGRSGDGLIWCKSGTTSKDIFYLFSEIKKRMKK